MQTHRNETLIKAKERKHGKRERRSYPRVTSSRFPEYMKCYWLTHILSYLLNVLLLTESLLAEKEAL